MTARLYLGRTTCPEEFYRDHASEYTNPHLAGVQAGLLRLGHHLRGRVLDLGCGHGLATSWLLKHRPDTEPFGLDLSPEMVVVYRQRTSRPCQVGCFSDPLPLCDSAVFCHSLHLARPEQAALVWWRLWEAGAQSIVVTSPFRNRPSRPSHYFLAEQSDGVSFEDATRSRVIHAWVCHRVQTP